MESKKIMPILIIGGLILFAIYKIKKDENELNKSHRYTIGTITEREYGLTKYYIDYYFFYEGNKKNTSDQLSGSIEGRRGKEYSRFVVEFNPGDLDNNKILFEYPILDDSLNAPIDGWLSIPDTIQFIPLE